MELMQLGPAGGVRRYMLVNGETIIGRRPDCRIVLDAPSIRYRHARLFSVDGNTVIHAIDDAWPVYVNGEPVEHRVLADGDDIELGPYRMRYLKEVEPGRTDDVPLAPEPLAAAHDDSEDTAPLTFDPVAFRDAANEHQTVDEDKAPPTPAAAGRVRETASDDAAIQPATDEADLQWDADEMHPQWAGNEMDLPWATEEIDLQPVADDIDSRPADDASHPAPATEETDPQPPVDAPGSQANAGDTDLDSVAAGTRSQPGDDDGGPQQAAGGADPRPDTEEPAAVPAPGFHLDILTGINQGRRVALTRDIVVLGFNQQRLVEMQNEDGALSLRRVDDEAVAHLNGIPIPDEPTEARPGDVISLQRIDLRIHQG